MPQNFKLRKAIQTQYELFVLGLSKLIFSLTTVADYSQLGSRPLKPQGYLIVANHRGAFDPFIICSSLPYRLIRPMMPVAFMTKNIFYDSPLRPLLWLSGCFPARNPRGKHSLYGVDASLALLDNGFSIFIFPEGTRVKRAARGPAHRGAMRIHAARPKVPLLLCHIDYHKGLKAWLSGKRRTLRYKLVENPNYTDPEAIMDDVFAL